MITTKMPLDVIDQWLLTAVGLPNELVLALSHNGLMETKGDGNTADIMKWANEVGVRAWYPGDYTAWCGLFKGINAKRAGWITTMPTLLSALAWLKWGNKIALDQGCVGDTVIFTRYDAKGNSIGGHVAYLLGYSPCGKYMRIFGGNQSDMVCATWKSVENLVGIRRAIWKNAQPAGVVRHVYPASALPAKFQSVSEA